MSISASVRQCLARFKDLEEKNAQRPDLEDEHGRFRIWAGNVSAHRAGGRRSLEYRLRDSSNLQSMVVTLLQDLLQALEDLGKVLKDGARSSLDDSSVTGQLRQEGADDSDDEDDAALFGVTEEGSPHRDPSTRVVEEIREINLCLLRFSMTLRNPARHDQMKESASTSTHHFERFDIDHVRDKFPSAETYLHERLGKGISKHRQYFKYREDHHSKLAEGLDDEEVKHERPSTIATSLNVPAPEAPTPQGNELETESLYTATSYAPTTAGDSPLRPPPLPEAGQDGSPFECPLCFGIVVAEDEAAWRQHLYEDLPPYICTHTNCISANQRYSRRRDWQRHLASAHNRYWLCPYGCSAHFDSEHTFQKHLIKKHGGDAATNQRLLETCAVASNEALDMDCPLCQKQLSSSKLWMKHLGHHLEQLALHAIPKHIFTLESDDESVGTGQSARSSESSAAKDEVDFRLNIIQEHGVDEITVLTDGTQSQEEPQSTAYTNTADLQRVLDLDIGEDRKETALRGFLEQEGHRQDQIDSMLGRELPSKWYSELGYRSNSLVDSQFDPERENVPSSSERMQSTIQEGIEAQANYGEMDKFFPGGNAAQKEDRRQRFEQNSFAEPRESEDDVNEDNSYQTLPSAVEEDEIIQTQNISIPADMVGCIIGRGGSKIAEIRKSSGARIAIAKAPHDETGERMFTIVGSASANEKALYLLYENLEDEKIRRIQIPTSQTAFEPSGDTRHDPIASQQNAEAIADMEAMGFPRGEIVRAMRAASFDPDRAIEHLLNGIPGRDQQERDSPHIPSSTPPTQVEENINTSTSLSLAPGFTAESVKQIYKRYQQMKADGIAESDPELIRMRNILQSIQQKTELLKTRQNQQGNMQAALTTLQQTLDPSPSVEEKSPQPVFNQEFDLSQPPHFCPVQGCSNSISFSGTVSLKAHLITHGPDSGRVSGAPTFRIPKQIATREALVRCGLTVNEDSEFFFLHTPFSRGEESTAQRREAGVGEIEEACEHEIQFSGICANCGMDMMISQGTQDRALVGEGDTTKDTLDDQIDKRHRQPPLSEKQSEAADSESAPAMQQLRELDGALAKFKADCQAFLQDGDAFDSRDIKVIHKRLSDQGLKEVILPLDEVDFEGDPEARALRKGMVAECQSLFYQIDEKYYAQLRSIEQDPTGSQSTPHNADISGDEYVNRARIVDASTEEETPRPESILKKPTDNFPEHLNATRESVASLKDVTESGIPLGAQWTKIDRKLVKAEALEEAGERFEERLDHLIVLRPLSKEEIQKLADRTKEMRQEQYEEERARRGEGKAEEEISQGAQEAIDELNALRSFTSNSSADSENRDHERNRVEMSRTPIEEKYRAAANDRAKSGSNDLHDTEYRTDDDNRAEIERLEEERERERIIAEYERRAEEARIRRKIKQEEIAAKQKKDRAYQAFLAEQEAKQEKEKAEKQSAEEDFQDEMRKRLRRFGYTEAQIEDMVKDESEKASAASTSRSAGDLLSQSRAPIWPKINVKYLSIETLIYYDLPWEYDAADSNYIIIKREMDKYETEILFEHTRRLQAGARSLLLDSKETKPITNEDKYTISRHLELLHSEIKDMKKAIIDNDDREDQTMNIKNRMASLGYDSEQIEALTKHQVKTTRDTDEHDRPYRCGHPDCARLQGFILYSGINAHEREVHGRPSDKKVE